MTIKYLKRKIEALRCMTRWFIARNLHVVGLQRLRRRKKRVVSAAHREGREAYVRWIRKCTDIFVKELAFADGTTFYLARGQSKKEDQRRRGLGPFVWRMTTNRDGLFSDSVGPSLYASNQGKPIKVWGILSNGHLCIYLLPLNEKGNTMHMNGPTYCAMMVANVANWKRACWSSRRP